MSTRCLILFLFLQLASSGFCFAQTEQANLNKYFAYRNWLKTRFEKIGPQPGESLPMENRLLNNSKVRWGDATVHMGFYLAMLATEYKLFMDESNIEKANETLNELYYAVNSLNRLDDWAEKYHQKINNYPPSRNGFFLRDDVPGNFIQNLNSQPDRIAGYTGLPNPGNSLTTGPVVYSLAELSSDFYFKDGASDPNNPTVPPDFYMERNEVSQDQFISLLMGFC